MFDLRFTCFGDKLWIYFEFTPFFKINSSYSGIRKLDIGDVNFILQPNDIDPSHKRKIWRSKNVGFGYGYQRKNDLYRTKWKFDKQKMINYLRSHFVEIELKNIKLCYIRPY